jgi:hypothetical protein
MASQARNSLSWIWKAPVLAGLVAVLLSAALPTGHPGEPLLPAQSDASAAGVLVQPIDPPVTEIGPHQSPEHPQISSHCFFVCVSHMDASGAAELSFHARLAGRIAWPDHLAVISRTIPPEPFPPKTSVRV